MSSRALVTEDLAALMREGIATFLGTSDERGTPEVTRAAGVAPAGGARLRLLISSEATTGRRSPGRSTRCSPTSSGAGPSALTR